MMETHFWIWSSARYTQTHEHTHSHKIICKLTEKGQTGLRSNSGSLLGCLCVFIFCCCCCIIVAVEGRAWFPSKLKSRHTAYTFIRHTQNPPQITYTPCAVVVFVLANDKEKKVKLQFKLHEQTIDTHGKSHIHYSMFAEMLQAVGHSVWCIQMLDTVRPALLAVAHVANEGNALAWSSCSANSSVFCAKYAHHFFQRNAIRRRIRIDTAGTLFIFWTKIDFRQLSFVFHSVYVES